MPLLPRDIAMAEVKDIATLVLRPDDLLTFRAARLLLLLDTLADVGVKKPIDIERLGFYDFFAANPFLVLGEDEDARREVALAGFNSYDLSYQSSGHRFANRRARLRNDLAVLVGYGTASADVDGQRVTYSINRKGRDLVAKLQSLYAYAYRQSAALVVQRLDRLSDKRLREDAKRWLNDDRLLIDLYDIGDSDEH
jgi:hypothetical protein